MLLHVFPQQIFLIKMYMYVPKLRTPRKENCDAQLFDRNFEKRTWVPVILPNLKTRLSSENKSEALFLFHERNRPQAWCEQQRGLDYVHGCFLLK
jgi:hypothetical protein